MDKISVVIPSFNNAPWLPQCLESLLAQTYENLEIIVVDDGSSDDTPAVLEAFSRRSPKILALRQENSGVTAARLRGIAAATGDWIGFVDGDDVVEPDFYARLHENAVTYGADISHCGYKRLLPDGTTQPHGGSGIVRVQDRQTGLRDLIEERIIEPGLCVKLFRSSLFAGLSDWMDPSIRNNEDMLMNYYLFSRGEKAVFQDMCLYSYRVRQGSASRGRLSEHKIYAPIRVRQRILEECGPELKDTAREALLRCQLYVYAQLTVAHDPALRADKEKVRQMIAGEKAYYHLLTTRNRILCHMIRLCPWAFSFAFRAYVAVVLHGQYE